MSAIEQIRQLEAQRDQLRNAAHEEEVANINEAISRLKELGFEYSLVLKEAEKRNSRSSRKPAAKPCPICNFETDPPHDRRHHRTQLVKKPFTDEELAERGWVKVPPPPLVLDLGEDNSDETMNGTETVNELEEVNTSEALSTNS